MNKIICGDCLDVMQTIPDESVDLIYMDPPFHSGTDYDAIWNNGYEIAHFKDKAWQWYDENGKRITGIHAYLGWLEERVRECKKVLKTTGSIYVHCDWHANAHIRNMLDKIFGANNFRNEIVWHYKRWTNASRNFQRMHDIILFYTKTNNHIFNIQYQPYSKASEKIYSKTGTRMSVDGSILHKKEGVNMDDVWNLSWLQSQSKERLGYPTQKPESLLERIIKASSNEGDVVLDPMSGGGTTIGVAKKLNRNWIGIDVSPTACRVMMNRVNKLGCKINEIDIEGYPMIEEELYKLSPLEFENYVRGRLHAFKPKDVGIDAITKEGVNWLPSKIKSVGIQIKRQYKVGRAIVEKLKGDIDIYDTNPINKEHGIIVGFSFSRDAIERVAEFKRKYNIEIKLMDVKELIDYKHKKHIGKWLVNK